jgi:hypothetical protein
MAQRSESFEHGCNMLVGKSIIPVPTFTNHGQKTTRKQLRQVLACARARKPGCRREFSRGQCPTIHQRAQHGGATRITDQCRRRCYLWLTHI